MRLSRFLAFFTVYTRVSWIECITPFTWEVIKGNLSVKCISLSEVCTFRKNTP